MALRVKRVPWELMGKLIGTASGWDMQDTFAIIIYDLKVNEAGRKFVPDFPDGNDLTVDWSNGTAYFFGEGKEQETKLKTDWSVFNR